MTIEPSEQDWQTAEAVVCRALEPRARLARHYDFRLRKGIAEALAAMREPCRRPIDQLTHADGHDWSELHSARVAVGDTRRFDC